MRRWFWTACVVVTAALLAACGSSSPGSGGSASSTSSAQARAGTSSRSALSACLKRHGLTLPAGRAGGAPGNGGAAGGAPPAGGTPPAGGAPPSAAPGNGAPGGGFSGAGGAKLRAAFKACGASLPNRPQGAGFSKAAITAYVACVRKHGYHLPAPNLTGK
jgi:hypothetical protein